MMNEPGFVPFVAVKLSEILGISVEDVCRITRENGYALYEL